MGLKLGPALGLGCDVNSTVAGKKSAHLFCIHNNIIHVFVMRCNVLFQQIPSLQQARSLARFIFVFVIFKPLESACKSFNSSHFALCVCVQLLNLSFDQEHVLLWFFECKSKSIFPMRFYIVYIGQVFSIENLPQRLINGHRFSPQRN